MQRRDPDGVESGAIEALVPLDGKRVLEIGCGEGRLTAFAASRASLVYAFDPNAERVEAARAALTKEQRRRVRFAVHEAEALDLERERFDVALCGWSLWCIPLKGVVHALHSIHRVLDRDATLVDTQPVSARPPVAASDGRLGTLDMREWAKTIRAVDELILSTVASGLYELRHESRLVVTDTYDRGDEFLEIVGGWAGTRITPALAQRVNEARPPITLRQEVKLRLFAPATGQ